MSITHFPVEAGHIMLFARAIGDPNPAYYGTDGHETLAPPTFVQAGAQFDPEYPLRPRLGQPWFGSGATPSGAARPTGEGVRLHAEQRFEYHRALRPGDVLHTTTSEPERWEKTNRRGQILRFQQDTTTYLTADDGPAVTARRVSVIVPPPSDDAAKTAGGAPRRPAPAPSVEHSGALDYRARLTDNLTRTQIVQYAGASGDYNPLHTDEVYATRAAGYPSVIAHGMLTMGITGRLLTDTFGVRGLLSFGGRFTAQVHPGDSLSATATGHEDAAGTLTLGVTTTNQDGVPVFVGEAVVKPG